MGWILGSALMAAAITPSGFAQAPSPPARREALLVKVQVVVTKDEGNKKVSSPYSLVTSSEGVTTSLRIGAEVPISTTGPDGQTRTTLTQIGMQIDCVVTATGDGRFSLKLNLNRRFVEPDGQMRTFTSTNTSTVGDGEPIKLTGSDDGGGAYTVDVVVSVVK
jgi:hypothetical protein